MMSFGAPPLDAYRIPYGQVLYRPAIVREEGISRRRRRRLRGLRKAGMLPSWRFRPLGNVQPFVFEMTEGRISRNPHRLEATVEVELKPISLTPVHLEALGVPRRSYGLSS